MKRRAVSSDRSIEFFDRQFARQIHQPDLGLNPFEQSALPHLKGKVLDYGCGMGQLSLAAARAGCSVVALDASKVAVNHLRHLADAEGLPIKASVADLRTHPLSEVFDTVVSIGLLMFFDCSTAEAALAELEAHLRPGGTIIVNVLTEGTTYMDMFDPQAHCLFKQDALSRRYAAWEMLSSAHSDFPAPGGLKKVFATVIARSPSTGRPVAPGLPV
jgi:tellurite methyltransferase